VNEAVEWCLANEKHSEEDALDENDIREYIIDIDEVFISGWTGVGFQGSEE
jgi:hypothetical protein